METPGKRRSRKRRHWPSACGCEMTCVIAGASLPGRPQRKWRTGRITSPRMRSGVSWMRISSVALTAPSSEFSKGRTPSVATPVSTACATAGKLGKGNAWKPPSWLDPYDRRRLLAECAHRPEIGDASRRVSHTPCLLLCSCKRHKAMARQLVQIRRFRLPPTNNRLADIDKAGFGWYTLRIQGVCTVYKRDASHPVGL